MAPSSSQWTYRLLPYIETFETGCVKPVTKFRVLQRPQSTFNIISTTITLDLYSVISFFSRPVEAE